MSTDAIVEKLGRERKVVSGTGSLSGVASAASTEEFLESSVSDKPLVRDQRAQKAEKLHPLSLLLAENNGSATRAVDDSPSHVP